jgi:hypothetical protein
LVTSEYVSFVYFIYDLPICRFIPGHGEMFNVMEAFDLLQGILDQDTTGFFPPNFSLYPTGAYGCLATDRTACP